MSRQITVTWIGDRPNELDVLTEEHKVREVDLSEGILDYRPLVVVPGVMEWAAKATPQKREAVKALGIVYLLEGEGKKDPLMLYHAGVLGMLPVAGDKIAEFIQHVAETHVSWQEQKQ
jgi:hypothetical protein